VQGRPDHRPGPRHPWVRTAREIASADQPIQHVFAEVPFVGVISRIDMPDRASVYDDAL